MPILYEPQTGMPVEVPDERINDFIGRGYLTTMPLPAINTTNTETSKSSSGNENSSVQVDESLVKINSTTLKELSERFGLSTTEAKELRDGRPYTTIENLVAKLPNIDWVALSPQISFE